MNETANAPATLAEDKPITIALLAMGGQGGGVLADWIVAVAEAQGWVAQSTSVPGVAQRTGATIYYIETLPARAGRPPVLSLMPTPGEVDVVVAAEWMEAGRSVLRGLVTPERTVLIASTHRAFAIAEKQTPGDGVADGAVVVEAADFAARQVIAFDMERLAFENGSVISAALLGALAGSQALPFPRAAYEDIVRGGAKGANASLAAFGAAYDKTCAAPRDPLKPPLAKRFDPLPADAGHPELNRLVARIREGFPNWRGRCCLPASSASSISRTSPMATNISIACASSPSSIAARAARSGASPSRARRPNMSRSPWPMTMSCASPI